MVKLVKAPYRGNDDRMVKRLNLAMAAWLGA